MSLFEIYWRALRYLSPAKSRVAADLRGQRRAGHRHDRRAGPVRPRSSTPSPKRRDLAADAVRCGPGFGVFNIVAFVLVARGADRLAHARRAGVLCESFERVISMPLSWHHERGTSNALHTLLRAVETLFGLWLEFMRQHLSTAVALVLLVPTAMSLDVRMSLVLVLLGVAYVAIGRLVMRKTKDGQASVERPLPQRLLACDRLGQQRHRAAELQPHRRGNRGAARLYPRPAQGAVSGARLVGAGQRAAPPGLDHLDDGRAADRRLSGHRTASCASATSSPSPALPRC